MHVSQVFLSLAVFMKLFFYLQEHYKNITFDNISPSFNIRYTCI